MPTSRSSLAFALVTMVVAACGGKSGVTPRGQRTVSDCERVVRHVVDTIAHGPRTAEQTRDIDQLVTERCADADYVAWVNDLPDATFACMLRAATAEQGDACMAALQWPEPDPAGPPPEAGPKCAAFTGATDGTATLLGIVTTAAGEPFAGATVVLAGGGDAQTTAITDERGGYVMLDVRPGTYELTVYALDQTVPKHCVDIAGAGGSTTVDVTLP